MNRSPNNANGGKMNEVNNVQKPPKITATAPPTIAGPRYGTEICPCLPCIFVPNVVRSIFLDHPSQCCKWGFRPCGPTEPLPVA